MFTLLSGLCGAAKTTISYSVPNTYPCINRLLLNIRRRSLCSLYACKSCVCVLIVLRVWRYINKDHLFDLYLRNTSLGQQFTAGRQGSSCNRYVTDPRSVGLYSREGVELHQRGASIRPVIYHTQVSEAIIHRSTSGRFMELVHGSLEFVWPRLCHSPSNRHAYLSANPSHTRS